MMQLDRNRLDKIRNKLMWMSKHAPSSFYNPDMQDLLYLLEVVDQLCPPDLVSEEDLEDLPEEPEVDEETETD